MKLNCILAGVGGQGTILASKLIAAAAMERGAFVRTAETIGMAQRGGSVVSHVRVGEEIHSPMIPKGEADLVIGFEPGEAVRCLPYLKEGGAVVVADRAIRPVTDSLGDGGYQGDAMLACLRERAGQLVVLDTAAIFAEAGTPRALNVALLGAAAGIGALGLSVEQLEAVVLQKAPVSYLESNKKALRAGAAAAEKAGQ